MILSLLYEIRVLYVGAHPDDIELGAAGSIIKDSTHSPVVKQYVVTFSNCGVDSGLGFTAEELVEDMRNSMKVMGIPWENVTMFDFPNTRLPEYAYEIRRALERLRDMYQPNIVYFPSEHDLHQDHVAVSYACMRAFRRGEELRCYEVDSSTSGFKPNLYINIREQMDKKVEALMCYSTQLSRRNYHEMYWRARALLRGNSVGLEYAEAFEILRRLE